MCDLSQCKSRGQIDSIGSILFRGSIVLMFDILSAMKENYGFVNYYNFDNPTKVEGTSGTSHV